MHRATRVSGRVAMLVVSASVALALCATGVVLVAERVGSLHLYRAAAFRLPALPQVSTVSAADGSELGLLGTEDREPVTYAEIPKVLLDAVVATEDHTFWSNPGVDVRGMTRAPYGPPIR